MAGGGGRVWRLWGADDPRGDQRGEHEALGKRHERFRGLLRQASAEGRPRDMPRLHYSHGGFASAEGLLECDNGVAVCTRRVGACLLVSATCGVGTRRLRVLAAFHRRQ